MLTLRNHLDESICNEKSLEIYNRLLTCDAYKKASHILIYMDFGSEVKTTKIIEDALLKQKKVYVPRIEQKQMEFYEIHSTKDCKPGFHNILEPDLSCERFKEIQSDSILMLLPGVAFDKQCYRMGYGGGYYDRYLANCPFHCTKLALAYQMQICDAIPLNGYDIPVDGIVTENQILKKE